MEKITIRWEVDDGYVGKSRPHSTSCSLEEFEGCETEQDVLERILELAEEDFQESVRICIPEAESLAKEIMELKESQA